MAGDTTLQARPQNQDVEEGRQGHGHQPAATSATAPLSGGTWGRGGTVQLVRMTEAALVEASKHRLGGYVRVGNSRRMDRRVCVDC